VRPAARLQTLSELLAETLSSRQAADFIVKQWGRQNRFAGSKDRRFLSDGLFIILRHYGNLRDRLGADDPLLITLLAYIDVVDEAVKITLDEALALADGQAHAPSPLSPEQIDCLRQALEKPANSRAGQLSVADWLLADLDAGLGPQADAVMQAMRQRAPLDVRVNTLKGDAAQASVALQNEGFSVQPHGFVSNALRLALPANVTASQAFEDGLIEVQDAGAQAVAQFAAPQPFQTVLDYCAGAGGKSLAMAALMNNRGRLIVHDSDTRRMRPIIDRAARAGVSIIETADAHGLKPLVGGCDVVMADVPCSGSGRWRRSPETKWRLSQESLLALNNVQLNIMKKAADYVAPNGRLVYVTCSVFASENERIIKRFLASQPAFELDAEPPQDTSSNGLAAALKAAGFIQLNPVSSDTDGLFCAVLRRREKAPNGALNSAQAATNPA
jgi:16S rRNA (cytosine967-C5)-methyltransferase